VTAHYYRHPKIFTGVDEGSYATAFRVEDGTFAWVGRAEDIPGHVEVTDLPGGTVVPGFLDAHTHPTLLALTVDAVPCTVPVVTSIPSMLAALGRHPAYGRGDSAWIQGWGYDESKLSEGRTPTRHDLDQVSRTQPVHVLRSDCHSGICNTRALELAGITRDTPDPPGAHFGRDDDGIPNGILCEHDANQVVMRAKGSAGFDADVDSLARTTRHLSERGIVACTDLLCVPETYDQLDQYRAAEEKGLAQSVRIYYHFETLLGRGLQPLPDSARTGRTAVGGIKLFVDGTISNRTAWLSRPYPGSRDTGMRLASRDLMLRALDYARDNRIQIACHAMGDRAIEEVVDVYGDEEPWLADVSSVRIEHASVLPAPLVRRIRDARMRFGVVTNIDFFFAEYDSYSRHLDAGQFGRTYPVADLYREVEDLALASDCPATTWADPDDPFMSIQAAVTRRAYNGADIVADQAITVAQALLLYTGRARRTVDLPGVGVIVPGGQASFLTLSEDVFTVDPGRIMELRVTQTWIRGEKVHQAE